MSTPISTPPLQCWIEGIAVLGPGLVNWPQARTIFAGQATRAGGVPTALPAPELLPPAERRRASRVIKLLMALGLEACAHAGRPASELAMVFASSTGDGHNCHAICETLATAQREVSPTRFHNSVHNTPAGYWCIATQATGPCQVMAGYDASFSVALLEAVVQVHTERRDVLFAAYDSDYPEPLRSVRPVTDAGGIALVLSNQQSAKALASMQVQWLPGDAPAEPASSRVQWAQLAHDIPALQGLRLLQALAVQEEQPFCLPSLSGQHLRIHLSQVPR